MTNFNSGTSEQTHTNTHTVALPNTYNDTEKNVHDAFKEKLLPQNLQYLGRR